MKASGFRNFEEAIKHISESIIEAVKPQLRDSKMKLCVNPSKQSNSIYIVLSYKREFIDQDLLFKKCFPYVIRVSDHPITSPFSMRDANNTIIVKPNVRRRDMQKVEFLKREINILKHRLYTLDDWDEKREVANSIFSLQQQINKILGNYNFGFDGNLDHIVNNLNSILEKNHKNASI